MIVHSSFTSCAVGYHLRLRIRVIGELKLKKVNTEQQFSLSFYSSSSSSSLQLSVTTSTNESPGSNMALPITIVPSVSPPPARLFVRSSHLLLEMRPLQLSLSAPIEFRSEFALFEWLEKNLWFLPSSLLSAMSCCTMSVSCRVLSFRSLLRLLLLLLSSR